MIAFKDIQSDAYALLLAIATFAAPAAPLPAKLLLDDGKISDAEAQALRAHGYYATVLPPLDGTRIEEAAGKSVLDAGLAVRVCVNPANASAPNIYDLVTAVKATLTARTNTKMEIDRYRVAAKAFVIDDSDAGEFAYILFFTKRCVF